MSNNKITIKIVSTIPDMFAEHYYFIKNVFPDLKEICKDYDIDLEYKDLIFTMSKRELTQCRSVLKYFESIDMDRTFFICFRGQKLGCAPTYRDIDKLTLDNQIINDLLLIIQSLDAEIPYAEYTKQEFDKYLNSIIYKP